MSRDERFPGENTIRSQKSWVVAGAGGVIAFLLFSALGAGFFLSVILGVAAYFGIIWLLKRYDLLDSAQIGAVQAPVSDARTSGPSISTPESTKEATSTPPIAEPVPTAGPQATEAAGQSERVRDAAREAGQAARLISEPVAEAAAADPSEGLVPARPAALDAPRENRGDDLKKIKGVGPKLEAMLQSLGFWHFDQIAAWTDAELAWVDGHLEGFNGRASRDEWVAQAKVLASGGETEFSERVDKGEVYD